MPTNPDPAAVRCKHCDRTWDEHPTGRCPLALTWEPSAPAAGPPREALDLEAIKTRAGSGYHTTKQWQMRADVWALVDEVESLRAVRGAAPASPPKLVRYRNVSWMHGEDGDQWGSTTEWYRADHVDAALRAALEAGRPPVEPETPNELPPAPCPITRMAVLDPDALLHWATAAVFGEKVPAEVQDEPLIQAIQRLREAGRPPVEPERER